MRKVPLIPERQGSEEIPQSENKEIGKCRHQKRKMQLTGSIVSVAPVTLNDKMPILAESQWVKCVYAPPSSVY